MVLRLSVLFALISLSILLACTVLEPNQTSPPPDISFLVEENDSIGLGLYLDALLVDNSRIALAYYDSLDVEPRWGFTEDEIEQFVAPGDVTDYKSTTNNLKFAAVALGSSRSNIVQIIDNYGDVGSYANISVDASHWVHILYYAREQRRLRLAIGQPIDEKPWYGAWTTASVAVSAVTESYTGFAVDANRIGYIALVTRSTDSHHLSLYSYDENDANLNLVRDLRTWAAVSERPLAVAPTITLAGDLSNPDVLVHYFREDMGIVSESAGSVTSILVPNRSGTLTAPAEAKRRDGRWFQAHQDEHGALHVCAVMQNTEIGEHQLNYAQLEPGASEARIWTVPSYVPGVATCTLTLDFDDRVIVGHFDSEKERMAYSILDTPESEWRVTYFELLEDEYVRPAFFHLFTKYYMGRPPGTREEFRMVYYRSDGPKYGIWLTDYVPEDLLGVDGP